MDARRIPFPGGSLATQALRDLVGWAGSVGCESMVVGDQQDLWAETPGRTWPGVGSFQSSAYAPTAPGVTWLTPGVWIDLFDRIGDPGPLDVQVVHDPWAGEFVRHGHLRFTASRQAHRWEVSGRRPGSGRATRLGTVDTGRIPGFVTDSAAAWLAQEHGIWEGPALAPPEQEGPPFSWEGFYDEAPGTFRFGLWTPSHRIEVTMLRDLVWLATASGVTKLWLTPGRVLVAKGIPAQKKRDWYRWIGGSARPVTHGELDHAVVAAGPSEAAREARREVLGLLAVVDRLPPGGKVVVATMDLNRDDGLWAQPWPVLIRVPGGWLYRSGDGQRAGEGTLAEVLGKLDKPAPPGTKPLEEPPPAPEAGDRHRCGDCLTLYEARFGAPPAVAPGTPFSSLGEDWICPVCGGPKDHYAQV